MNLPILKTTLCAGGSIICGLALKVLKNHYSKSEKCDINEILFYGSEDQERMEEIGLNNLYCIYYVLSHASRTIDVCLPSLESDTIAQCLVDVQLRSLAKVRIAIHNSKNYDNFKEFIKCGIQVKVVKLERLEHEFILIDSEDLSDAVAVIGSVDYEKTQVNCNMDTTLITSEAAVVQTLKREFNRVWNSVQEIMVEKEN